MNDHDLEQALRDWAKSDADVPEPARLRERVMAVPERAQAGTHFRWPSPAGWLRRRPFTASATAAVVLVLFAVTLIPLVLLGPDERDTTGEAGATLVVAQDASGDFATISDAVGAAMDGDTILVRPGTYLDSILIDKDITLRGDGDRDEIVITSPSDLPDRLLPREEQPYAIRLDDTDATVENVTLTGPASALIVRGGSPRITNVAVIDVGIANQGRHLDASRFAGLALVAGSTAQVRDSVLRRSDVVVHDGAEAALVDNELDASMIQLGDKSGVGAEDPDRIGTLIQGNVSRDAWIAIWVDHGATARIEDNEISAAENAATWILSPGIGSVIQQNTIRDSKTAIMLVGGAPIDVIENDLSGNQIGLNISGTGSSVRRNEIRGNTVGVVISFVDGGTSPTLEGNTIEGNVRGISISAGASPLLTANVVCDNETNLSVVDGADVTFEDNRICAEVPSAQAP